MIEKFAPYDLARMTKAGCPWHGLVSGGSLALPNASSMTWPQPAGGEAWLFSVPGLPAPQTSEAEVAAGKAWRNVAILSGYKAQLYGRDLGEFAWLYCDANGAVWHIKLNHAATGYNVSALPSLSFTARRFGVFGGDASTRTITVSMSDWGIASGTVMLYISDIALTGAKICFGARGYSNPVTSAKSAVIYPIAFLEIAVSGTTLAGLSLTPSIASDEAATLGSYSLENTVGESWDYTFTAITTWGGDPVGVNEYTNTIVDERTLSATRRLAAWYDGSGVLGFVVATVSGSYATTRTETLTLDNYSDNGNGTWHISTTTDGSWSYDVDYAITLSWGEHAIAYSYTMDTTDDVSHLADSMGLDSTTSTGFPYPISTSGDVQAENLLTENADIPYDPDTITDTEPGEENRTYAWSGMLNISAIVMPHFYSATLIGLSKTSGPGSPDAYGALTKWGASTSHYTGGNNYGSADPVTQIIVAGQSAPVCYV